MRVPQTRGLVNQCMIHEWHTGLQQVIVLCKLSSAALGSAASFSVEATIAAGLQLCQPIHCQGEVNIQHLICEETGSCT